jgi:hypothetical protein
MSKLATTTLPVRHSTKAARPNCHVTTVVAGKFLDGVNVASLAQMIEGLNLGSNGALMPTKKLNEPASLAHNLLLHHRDIRRGATERHSSKFEEHERQFG